MDIKITSDEGRFKFRVCGITVFENKVLLVKIMENEFYCLPGGHVEIGESTREAVVREMNEELWFPVRTKKLGCIMENVFKTPTVKTFHEIGYYYYVAPKSKKFVPEDKVFFENDKGVIKKLDFKWFSMDELFEVDLRPKMIKDEILRNGSFRNLIYKE